MPSRRPQRALTLRPLPTVEGHSVPGGYSGQAVRPIALRQVMEVARANPGVEISGIGGIETGTDAAQFMLLGASTVQVCTGAMLRDTRFGAYFDVIGDTSTHFGEFPCGPTLAFRAPAGGGGACC